MVMQLRTFVEKKKVEIEELCKVHYEEFIRAVDELRYVLVDADELKHGLAMQNAEMQEVGSGLLHKLDELIQHNAVKTNLATALSLLRKCKAVVDLCAKVCVSAALCLCARMPLCLYVPVPVCQGLCLCRSVPCVHVCLHLKMIPLQKWYLAFLPPSGTVSSSGERVNHGRQLLPGAEDTRLY